MPTLELDFSTCINCGQCAKVCPLNVFKKDANGQVAPQAKAIGRCIECGQCVALCPTNSLTLDGIDPDSLQPVENAPLTDLQRDMLFKGRRSIRHFKDGPVPRDILLAALEDARYAPTGNNTMQTEWVLVEDRAQLRAVGERIANWLEPFDNFYSLVAKSFKAGGDPIFRNAPGLIIAATREDVFSPTQDAAEAIAFLELSLHSRGVGSCWCGYIGWATESGIDLGLPLPAGKKAYGGLLIGMPIFRFRRLPPRPPLKLTVL